MGITGLLPFLQKSSHRANIREYSGSTVALDAYCFLHKGAFSCAEKLIMKEPTTQYVSYCMKFVHMLLSHNIKPILVFDGQNLTAKAGTEQKRRQNRDINRRKGMELMRAGRVSEGRNVLRRALDVTHLMALEVIKECRRHNVDCIVAPHEADAQLAYFSLQGIADVIITEDSDLLLFGCKTVMFKMDVTGNGVVVDRDKLYLSMGIRSDEFTLDKFRFMCILSGCDYVDSLPGIGLIKACKFVTRSAQSDIYKSLEKLASNLNMWTLEVSEEYKQAVVAADLTFRCQLVFDPKTKKQVPLTTPKPGEEPVGDQKEPATAFQLALGNLNPKNLERVDNYDPAKPLPRGKTAASHASIWAGDYHRPSKPASLQPTIMRCLTKGKTVKAEVSVPTASKRQALASPPVEPIEDDDEDFDLLRLYSSKNKRSKVALPSGSLQVSRYFTSLDESESTSKKQAPNSSEAFFNQPSSQSRQKTDSISVLGESQPKKIIPAMFRNHSSHHDDVSIPNKKLESHVETTEDEEISELSQKENVTEAPNSPVDSGIFSLTESSTNQSGTSEGSWKSPTSSDLSSNKPALKAFNFKSTQHPAGALTKLDDVPPDRSYYFNGSSSAVTLIRTPTGKARSVGLSRKKPAGKQSSISNFFSIRPKIPTD